MGNYLFSTDVLIEALRKDAANPNSRHDMGGDIIPMLVDERCAHVYDFMTNKVPGASERDAGYWRDVGTLRFLLRRAHGPVRDPPRVQPL